MSLFLLLQNYAIAEANHSYQICYSIKTLENLHTFVQKDGIELGSFEPNNSTHILFNNSFIQIRSEVNRKIDRNLSKISIEFLNGDLEKPIAEFTSDQLDYDSVRNMGFISTNIGGKNETIDLVIKNEQNFSIAFIRYVQKNITVYVRTAWNGVSFGVRSSSNGSGLCSQIHLNRTRVQCISNSNLNVSFELCKRVLERLSLDDEEELLKNCVSFVSHSEDVWSAFDRLSTLIDNYLLANFDSIKKIDYRVLSDDLFKQHEEKFVQCKVRRQLAKTTHLDNVAHGDIYFDETSEYLCKNVLELNQQNETFYVISPQNKHIMIECNRNGQIVQKCALGSVMGEDLKCHPAKLANIKLNRTNTKIENNLVNSFLAKFSRITKRNEKRSLKNTKPLLQVNVHTPQIFGRSDLSRLVEFDQKCQKILSNNVQSALFMYFPHPKDNQFYVQCDQAGRAFLRRCPLGTIFSVNLMCERKLI
jgi:hypothetical protein